MQQCSIDADGKDWERRREGAALFRVGGGGGGLRRKVGRGDMLFRYSKAVFRRHHALAPHKT